MVRMSDILKHLKETGKEEGQKEDKKKPPLESKKPEIKSQPPQPEEAKTPVKEALAHIKEKGLQKEEKEKVSEVRISSVTARESNAASKEETEKLYDRVLSSVKEALKKDVNYSSIDTKKFITHVEKLINQLKAGSDALLMLALTKDTAKPHYLFGHTVNVCILSIEVGLAMGLDRDQLIELGFSALLHDIGMAKYLDLANQPRKLNPEEYSKIQKHPEEGAKALEKIKDITEAAIAVSLKHHERLDGLGYPKGLKTESIDEYVRIVSAVDVYEAMMHPRIYRSEYPSMDTMRELLEHKRSFDYKVIKVLIESIGIFPVGSHVILNTKEVAQVVKINHKVPLRPVVEITVDSYGKKLEEPKALNLTKEPNICIIKGIKKSEIRTK